MIITRQTDYALRVLRALKRDGKTTADVLAENEQVPSAYLYKIISKLAAGGFITNTRGRSGGISLNCDLKDVSLFDIVELMEEDDHICACASQDYDCLWRQKHGECAVHCKLLEVQKVLDEQLRQTCLDDLF